MLRAAGLSPLARFLEDLDDEAEARRRLDQERSLALPRGIDFTSNDYLGLSRHPGIASAMRAALGTPPHGAPASRLLRGTHEAHLELERKLASWKGTEAALLFPTGYSANMGVLSALVSRDDRVLSDASNHASLIDGIRLTGATREIYPHLDLAALEERLATPHEGRTFVVTESIFSMEGDLAPLDRICDLAEREGALVIIDDAHGTGVFGEGRGSGLAEVFQVERRAAAIVSTCGKALGLAGAFVAGPAQVVNALVNKARAFIFSTAIPPVLVAGIGAAVSVCEQEPALREKLRANSASLRGKLSERGIQAGGAGPIVPIVLGDNARALEVAERVRERGFDVRAVRPPTVPEGTSRIRISVHADHTEEQISGLARAVGAALA